MTKPKFKSRFVDPLDMAGTEGTHSYIVVAYSPLGRVGYRLLDGRVRVRIEPETAAATDKLTKYFPAEDWKQPSVHDQDRFSRVFGDADEAIRAIERSIEHLGRRSLLIEILKGMLGQPIMSRNPNARYWRGQLRKHLSSAAGVTQAEGAF